MFVEVDGRAEMRMSSIMCVVSYVLCLVLVLSEICANWSER